MTRPETSPQPVVARTPIFEELISKAGIDWPEDTGVEQGRQTAPSEG